MKRESLILVSPPPVMPERWKHPDKDLARTKEYAKECSLVAGRYDLVLRSQYLGCCVRLKIKYLDLFASLMNLTNLEGALSDGLHLARLD